MKKLDLLLLTIILLVAFVVRLYKVNTPLADFHSWRQVDTSAVTRNFVKDGIDFLHPRYDDLSSIETGLENPQGYRMVEFPIYNAIVATFVKAAPFLTVEEWGRVTTNLFSLIIIAVIYYLARREVGILAALASSLTYAVFPFFIFFSRVVLPDTTAVACSFAAIFFLYKWRETKNTFSQLMFFTLSVTFFGASLLIKPTVIFYAIPLLFIFFYKYRLAIIKRPTFYLFFILGFIPLILWRRYILAFPEGIPASDWLFTSVNTYEGLKNIFFRPAFFRWIFYERINNHILGGYLTFFLGLGMISRLKTHFIHIVAASALLYLLVFQGGNVQHEYYQIIILPALALLVGVGLSTAVSGAKHFLHPLLTIPIVVSFVALSAFFSYYTVKDFYEYPKELPQIARVINELTTDKDRIVTDRVGDTTLLYLTGRKGSPAFYKDIPELKKLGYTHFVTLHKETAADVELKYKLPILFQSNEFTLFSL